MTTIEYKLEDFKTKVDLKDFQNKIDANERVENPLYVSEEKDIISIVFAGKDIDRRVLDSIVSSYEYERCIYREGDCYTDTIYIGKQFSRKESSVIVIPNDTKNTLICAAFVSKTTDSKNGYSFTLKDRGTGKVYAKENFNNESLEELRIKEIDIPKAKFLLEIVVSPNFGEVDVNSIRLNYLTV